MTKRYAACLAAVLFLAGCAEQMMPNDRALVNIGGALGKDPSTLRVLSRSRDGTNTFMTIADSRGRRYACVVNGGNWSTLGMINPPSCRKI